MHRFSSCFFRLRYPQILQQVIGPLVLAVAGVGRVVFSVVGCSIELSAVVFSSLSVMFAVKNLKPSFSGRKGNVYIWLCGSACLLP